MTSTFEAILKRIAERALSSAEIRYGKRVIGIESSENARDAKHPVTLRTDDGCSQSFDEVILTTPLGWLKRNKDAFAPALPSRLAQAIDNLSVGQLEKVGYDHNLSIHFLRSAISCEDPVQHDSETGLHRLLWS